MLKQLRLVRNISREISHAADEAFSIYREGRVVEEPSLMPIILKAIEDHIGRGYFGTALGSELSISREDPASITRATGIADIAWKFRILKTGRGSAGEEKRYGADMMGVLDVDVPGYRSKKGFLAQAKMSEPSHRFRTKDWEKLRQQCKNMLACTPDSFVLIFSRREGIRMVSAQAVLGLESRQLFDLYNRSLSTFFENHIICHIGDHRLDKTDIEQLETLRDMRVENVFELSAKTV